MGMSGDHANFDFDACLAYCRGLWQVATQAEQTDSQRQRARTPVMETWKGKFADDTTTSMGTASTNASNAASAMKAEANGWAQIWSQEWLKEANACYQDAANQADSHKHWWQKAWDDLTGDDTYSDHPRPQAPDVPQPPQFWGKPLPSYDFG